MEHKDITAEKLYSDYTQAYFDLYNAQHEDLDDEELGDQSELRGVIETIELEVAFTGMDPGDAEYVQYLLTLRAEPQSDIARFKIHMKMSKIIGARARLNIQNIIESEVLKENMDKYHSEALEEDVKRSESS